MNTTSNNLATEALVRLGERLRLARTERQMRQADLAERIGRARSTVVAIEKGSERVEIGAYVAALLALGLISELDRVADPGRRYDLRLRVRTPKLAKHA